MRDPYAEADRAERELLELRAAQLASVEQDATRESLGALVVTVEQDRYALPIGAVREVVSECRITPVPCAPASVRGVVNLRGEIVSVTDLAMLLGLRREGAVRPAPLVVITDGSVTTALLVDGVEDMAEVPADGISAPLPVLDREHAEAVAGSFATADGPVALLEPAALLVPVGVEG